MHGEPEHFYMVKRDGHCSTSFMHRHVQTAMREAKRLARENPGQRFFVLKTVGFAMKEDAGWHEMGHDEASTDLDSEIPF